VGLQLYTVRELMASDPLGTLSQVAALGYQEVEFAGYGSVSPAQWKSALDNLGLTAPAAHFQLDVFKSSFQSLLDNAVTLGHRFLVMPYTPQEMRSGDGYRQLAQLLNDWGAQTAQSGVSMVFHNHDFDFAPLPDECQHGMDLLFASVDPQLVQFELDVYWITLGGYSAAEYLQQHPGRFPLCHLKDMTELSSMADVGYGTLDWNLIVGAARSAGVQNFFVEHDATSEPLQSARRSHDYLVASA
jgi:sugar phosphate isomerase/epimerase